MSSFAIVPLLLLPLILPSATQKQSLPQFYESLREFPRLPPSPTLLDRTRYFFHTVYFQYLVTGPGYVLEPAERIFFDLFITILLGATVWCAALVSPPLIRLIQEGLSSGLLNGKEVSAGEEVVRWSGNMSLSVRTVFGTASAVRNRTTIFGA